MNGPTINNAFLDAVVSGARRSGDTVQGLQRLPGWAKRGILGSDPAKARQAARELFRVYFTAEEDAA